MISPSVPGEIPMFLMRKNPPGSNFQPAMAGFGWIEFPDGSRTWVELRDCVGSRPVTGEVNTQKIVVVLWLFGIRHQMGMDQYLLIPFLEGWTSIYQLFWCELQGYKVLTHCQMNSKDQMTQWCRIWMNLVYGVVLTLLCEHLRKWKKASFNWRVLLQVALKHAQILPGTLLKSPHQWIGLRENLPENLQETRDFAMKYGEFL